MLPGWMAGHYTQAQCRIDLRPLAQAAGVALVLNPVTQLDAAQRCVYLADGRRVDYDLLSLDIGSETASTSLSALGDKLLPIKPLDTFFATWPALLVRAKAQPGFQLVVVGAGARPAPWLAGSGLALDDAGYILVDAHHRSLSHAEVCATGDTCARQDVAAARQRLINPSQTRSICWPVARVMPSPHGATGQRRGLGSGIGRTGLIGALCGGFRGKGRREMPHGCTQSAPATVNCVDSRDHFLADPPGRNLDHAHQNVHQRPYQTGQL